MASSPTPPLTTDELAAIWFDLNVRYFDGALPPIDLVWSRRLTSSIAPGTVSVAMYSAATPNRLLAAA